MVERNKKEEVEKTPEITVNVTATKAKETKTNLVEVTTKENFRIYYGDRWYNFTKDTPVKVTNEIKDYLKKQDVLAVL